MNNLRASTMRQIFFLSILVLLFGCAKPEKTPDRAGHISGKTVAETIQESRQRLLSIPGVIEIMPGLCDVDSCIKVVVEKKTEILISQIPLMLETWRVDVVERGSR